MYTSTDQEGVLQYEEQGRVVKWKARLMVKGRTQSAETEQYYVVILSEYESSGRVWRLLRTIYGQVRTLDTDRYLRHIGFVTTENSDYIYIYESAASNVTSIRLRYSVYSHQPVCSQIPS